MDIAAQYVRRRSYAQGCAFWVSKKQQNLASKPLSLPKPPFWGAISTVLRSYRPKNSLNIRGAKSKRPLNVTVAP